MNRHEQIFELLGPYALHALDEAEQKAVEVHLTSCTLCQAELASFEEVSSRLADLSPRRRPPPDLRGRVLAAVEREAQVPPRPRVARPRFPTRFVTTAIAIAFLGLQAWLLAQLSSLQALVAEQQQIQTVLLSSDEAPVHLHSPDPASRITALYRDEPALHQGILSYYNVPPLASGQSYRCWFELPDGSTVNCGRLPVEPGGHGLLLFAVPEPHPVRVQVTIESGSTTTPTGPAVLLGDLNPADEEDQPLK